MGIAKQVDYESAGTRDQDIRSCLRVKLRASWGEVTAIKSDDLSLIPRTHDGKENQKLFHDCHTGARECAQPTNIHMLISTQKQ